MIGSLLFRNTLQDLKKLHVRKIPWDKEIVCEELKKDQFNYFEMLLSVDQVKFNHCVKPMGAIGDQGLMPFSDGNPDAFGVCSHTLYDLKGGTKSGALMMP